jgi:DNA-binding transcriptional MerR regulator
MRIGELGERAGVSPKAIRYYEDIGLLPSPPRLPSGYRDYGEVDVSRLLFVRAAQRLGLALSDIAEILAFRERAERPCAHVMGVLDRQLADIDRRMTEMAQLRTELRSLRAAADRLPPEAGTFCAVIEHSLAGADGAPAPTAPSPSRG